MKPTHLYIKTHNVTGLKYFGKTTANPYTYKGSGKYWVRHLRKHGNDVTTEVIGTFTDLELCQKVAIEFSLSHSIIESPAWANFKVENGLDGGFSHLNDGSPAHKERCSNAGRRCHEKHPLLSLGNIKAAHTPESRAKGVLAKKERYGEDYFRLIASYTKTDEHKQKLSIASKLNNAGAGNRGIVRTKVQCPHCGKEGAKNVMVRFHFDSCKSLSR